MSNDGAHEGETRPLRPREESDDRARRAARRILDRRDRLRRAPLAELRGTVHEGHRY